MGSNPLASDGTKLAPKRRRCEDPLPRIAKIARRTVRKLGAPALDDEARASAWTPHEVAAIFATAKSTARHVYGVCLFQYSTGCRIGEALAMRWVAVDLERGRVTIRLRIHAGEVGPVKTTKRLRVLPIPQQLNTDRRRSSR